MTPSTMSQSTLAVLLGILAVSSRSLSCQARILLVPVVRLSSSGDSVDIHPSATVALSPTGTLVARVSAASGAPLAAFDGKGRLTALISKRGGGPGELFDVGEFGFGPGDSLFAQDATSSRVSVFTPELPYRFARSFAVPIRSQVRIDGDNLYTLVFATAESRSGLVWHPARRLAWDGTVLRAFGGPEFARKAEYERFVPIGTDAIWTAATDRYELELRRADAVALRVTRALDWFPTYTTPDVAMPWTTRPRSSIAALSVDGRYLWVLLSRASRNWKPFVGGATSARPGLPPKGLRPEDLFEWVLEAFDQATGKWAASLEVKGSVAGFAAPGVVRVRSVDDDGMTSVRLLRARVVQ